MSNQKVMSVENRSIDFIPHEERHGRPFSLFTLWFGGNMQVTSIAAGAISVMVGLPLSWAIIGSVLGMVIGAVFMALHSAQGPILGVPQMIQSRAQFGYYGAIIPLVLVILMYLGYFSVTSVQGGAAFQSLTHIDIVPSIVIVVVIMAVLAAVGYKLLHSAEKWLSILSGIAFLILTVYLVVNNNFSNVWSLDGFSWPLFMVAVTVAATWQLTYAPYVADYSRYLPANTSVRASFWWTYLGSVISSSWMFAFGAMAQAVASEAFAGGSVDFIVQQAPFGQPIFLIIIIGGVVGVNALNLYGAFMSSTTVLNSLFRFTVTRTIRIVIIAIVAIVGTVLAIAGKDDFLWNFLNFILFLAYFLIPWTAINLADFYMVRKEKYSVAALFQPRGEYGGFDWRALTAYAFGIIVEIPFIATSFYTGPFAAAMGGVDISWLLGIPAAGGLYVILMKLNPTRKKYPADTSVLG